MGPSAARRAGAVTMTARFIALALLLASAVGPASAGQLPAETIAATPATPAPQPPSIDHALAGQATDILTTAGALALGMSEANPLFGPLVNDEPLAGLLLLGGLKYGMIALADSRPYAQCVEGRTTAARMGYAFGAHNVAATVGTLAGWASAATPAGILAGILAWSASADAARADAKTRCGAR
jgi:hypothetical protein